MGVRKTYGLRIYKDGNPCSEHTYYSLEKIHRKTIEYENSLSLSESIKEKFKLNNSKLYDPNSFYTAEIVYYTNKKDTQEIAKKSEYGDFKSNGVSSEYIPILYKKDEKIFNLKYLESRFYSLLTMHDPRFRNRLKEFYESSTKPAKDKYGNDYIKPSINIYRDVLIIIKAYNNGTSNELEFNIGKLYDKVILGSLAERTKIYKIMEDEFPLKETKKVQPQTVQTKMDYREEVPWIDYFKIPEEERYKYKQGPIQKDDSIRLVKLIESKDKPKSR